MIVVLLDIILYGFGWLINLLYRLKKGKGMDFFITYYERIGSTNAYALARFLWQVDLRPLADKLTKDYLIIGGSKNTMSSRASIGRQMYLLKNAKSITAREITEKELGADHCSCGNQQVVMDMIDRGSKVLNGVTRVCSGHIKLLVYSLSSLHTAKRRMGDPEKSVHFLCCIFIDPIGMMHQNVIRFFHPPGRPTCLFLVIPTCRSPYLSVLIS